MQIISHRGNINGPVPVEENNPQKVMEVIYQGYDCEIDLWWTKDGYFLGHNQPKYKIEHAFLINRHLWIHCKNLEALVYLLYDSNLNLFYHTDGIALTTKGYLWTAPGLLLTEMSVAVMPEFINDWDIHKAYGICTDYPSKYK